MTLSEFRVAVNAVPSAGVLRERYGFLLYSLVRYLRPSHVVEIGTWRGYSCAWMARALQDNEHGHLTAIDDWSLSGASLAETSRSVVELGLGDLVSFVPGDSLQTPWPKPAEFVFLDGNHSLQVVAREVEKAGAHGARTIVLHDTTSWWGPSEWLARVRHATAMVGEDNLWDFVEFPDAEGLTVLHRRQPKPQPQFDRGRFPNGYIHAVGAKA